jgi:hypothetical protein
VKTITRIGLTGALAAGVVVGTFSVAAAAPKEVSTSKYAKTVCGAYSDIQDGLSEFTDAYNALPADDPATFQTQTADLTTSLVDDISALRTKLKNQYPDVDDGKKISKLFASNLKEINSEITSALETFQAADPTGVAFQADVTTFEVAINILDTKTSDPFSKVTDQDVIGAFDDEKSCDDVVTIIGG